jgi:hypothetical protein
MGWSHQKIPTPRLRGVIASPWSRSGMIANIQGGHDGDRTNLSMGGAPFVNASLNGI